MAWLCPNNFLMTLALGIDPGTATTGYGLVRLLRDGELVAVSFGVISTPKESTPAARLEVLFDQLNDLLKEHKPDTAAVEKLFFQSNVKTALAVGQACGVIMLCLQKAASNLLNTPQMRSNKLSQVTAVRINARCRIWYVLCSNWRKFPNPTTQPTRWQLRSRI